MNVIVLSDLRALPVSAALSLKNRVGSNTILLTTRDMCLYDYGCEYSGISVTIKLFILKTFFGLKLVEERGVKNKEELEKYDNLGMMSSLYSITNDSLASPSKYPMIWERLVRTNNGVTRILGYLSSQKLESVYIFNGRLASSYPIVKYTKAKNIPTYYYEYGRSTRNSFLSAKYTLTNFAIHDLGRWGNELVGYFCGLEETDALAKIGGEKFVLRKLSNRFTSHYKSNAAGSYDIVVFLSSSHEYMALSQDIDGANLFESETEFLETVISHHGPDLRYAVRSHPNQTSDLSWRETLEPLRDFCSRNGIDYFPPDSNVSSYSLIRNCKMVAVDISSIGLDALFLGKPIVIYGNPDYKCAYDFSKNIVGDDIQGLAKSISGILSLREVLFQHELTKTAKLWYFSDYYISRLAIGVRRLFS